MEFFNDIIGTLPYMDFSDNGNDNLMNNPSELPTNKNAIFKVKISQTETGTIYCFDGVLYRIAFSSPERTLIQRWTNVALGWFNVYDSDKVKAAGWADRADEANWAEKADLAKLANKATTTSFSDGFITGPEIDWDMGNSYNGKSFLYILFKMSAATPYFSAFIPYNVNSGNGSDFYAAHLYGDTSCLIRIVSYGGAGKIEIKFYTDTSTDEDLSMYEVKYKFIT